MTFALCGVESVELRNAGVVRGRDQLTGEIGAFGHVAAIGSMTISNSGRIEGDVVVGGDLLMTNKARVVGDVLVGGSATLANQATIEGTVTPFTVDPQLCTCNFDLAGAMATAEATNDNARLQNDPTISQHLQGGALVLRNGDSVAFPSGRFFLTGLTIENTSSLSVQAGAQVRIYVSGDVELRNAAAFNFPPALAADVWIIADTAAAVALENSTESSFTFYAPNSPVSLVNSSTLYGSIVGRTIDVANTGTLARSVGPTDRLGIATSCPPPP